MSDFKVDEHGMTHDGYSVLPRKSMKSMYTRSLIILAAIVIITAILYPIITDSYEISSMAVTAFFALIVLIAIYLLIWPAVYYARYRYRIKEDRIDIRRGVFVVRHTVVPTERIHQLEVARGPINNLFGLADVTMTTAGGIATIQYLDKEVATKIADSLNEYITDIIRRQK